MKLSERAELLVGAVAIVAIAAVAVAVLYGLLWLGYYLGLTM